MAEIIENCQGFEWDDRNSSKNWHLHRVSDGECEEIFFNLPLIIALHNRRKTNESRFFALGQTETGRKLFVAFTVRNKLIRVISAREMTRSEGRKYAEKIKRDTDI